MPSFLIIAVLFIIAALSSGCQKASSTTVSSNNNTSVAVSNTAAKPAEPKQAEPVAAMDSTTTGSLATPTEAYKTAYELRKKKDVAGLKKIMSKDIIEFLTMMGESEKPKKSLDEMIAEMFEKPQADKAEVRNEKIAGDRATVEYLTETGNWKTMDFEKIEGKWLLSFPKADKGDDREAEK